MRRILKISSCATALLLATVVSGLCAGDKIAVMDFEQVLKEFHKTKPAVAELERQAADFKTEMDRRLKTLDQMGQDYETARDASRNKALNEDVVQKKISDAEKKLMELREYQQNVRKYSDDEKKRIVQERTRVIRRLAEEVREVVRKYSVEKGYIMVIDSSSSIEDLRGAVVCHDDGIDITSAILGLVNGAETSAVGKAGKTEPKK